jgi:hypothetical protein
MSIHVERTGGPPDSPSAFARFVAHYLGGRSLDDQKDEEAKLGKFPDFASYRDVLLIKMKHLEVEQNERINEAYKSRVLVDEEPMHYGTRRLDLSAFSNGHWQSPNMSAPTTPSAGAWPRRVATARSICSAATASSTARLIV